MATIEPLCRFLRYDWGVRLDLQARARALEAACFDGLPDDDIARLREENAAQPGVDGLRRASGLIDPDTLDALATAGISADTMFAFALVPLIEVAWADDEIHPRERAAIMGGAADAGITPDSADAAVLTGWLERRPPRTLVAAWTGYISALVQHLTAKQRKDLMRQVVDRAAHVARAAGGLLGLASISEAERNKLDELESAFKFPEQFAGVFDADD